MFAQLAHGYRPPPNATLEEVLPRYVRHLGRRRTAVFNTAAELGLFSRLEIPNVVFLVRHPLHALGSWAKPERHGELVDRLGGVAGDRALATSPGAGMVAAEIGRLESRGLLGGVVRYEFAAADARPLGLGWVVAGLDSSRRNPGVLGPETRARLHELVRGEFDGLYPDWAI